MKGYLLITILNIMSGLISASVPIVIYLSSKKVTFITLKALALSSTYLQQQHTYLHTSLMYTAIFVNFTLDIPYVQLCMKSYSFKDRIGALELGSRYRIHWVKGHTPNILLLTVVRHLSFCFISPQNFPPGCLPV